MLDKAVALRLLLFGVFSILISGNRLFLPNAVLTQHLLKQCTKTVLRAKRRFLKYARKTQTSITGNVLFLDGIFLVISIITEIRLLYAKKPG